MTRVRNFSDRIDFLYEQVFISCALFSSPQNGISALFKLSKHQENIFEHGSIASSLKKCYTDEPELNAI